MFAFFFPSLAAGPIKRYQPFLPSLRSGLTSVAAQDVKLGLMRVALGHFKKLVVADDWRRHEIMYHQGQLAYEREGYHVV